MYNYSCQSAWLTALYFIPLSRGKLLNGAFMVGIICGSAAALLTRHLGLEYKGLEADTDRITSARSGDLFGNR
jgi:hypothetical protein